MSSRSDCFFKTWLSNLSMWRKTPLIIWTCFTSWPWRKCWVNSYQSKPGYEGGWKVHRLKCSYYDVIAAVDYFFDQSDPSTATLMKEVCVSQRGLFGKYKPHLVIFYWSAYELFSRPSYENKGCVSIEIPYVELCLLHNTHLYLEGSRIILEVESTLSSQRVLCK